MKTSEAKSENEFLVLVIDEDVFVLPKSELAAFLKKRFEGDQDLSDFEVLEVAPNPELNP